MCAPDPEAWLILPHNRGILGPGTARWSAPVVPLLSENRTRVVAEPARSPVVVAGAAD